MSTSTQWPAETEPVVMYSIQSDHPWAMLPMLVEAGIITAEDARDRIIFAQQSLLRRAFRELMAELNVLFQTYVERDAGDPHQALTREGLEKLQGILGRAQADELPDL